MPLPDHHPDKWQYDEHTKVKHQLLEKYIKTWISIMGSFNRKLGYVDGFAGRGVYNDGSPGSPIIVMKAAQEQINKIGKVKEFLCLLIENDKENFQCLTEQIDSAKANCKDIKCNPVYGNFNDIILKFLEKLDENRLIPILYFIDPFGWSGIPFSTVRRLLEQPKSEILFVLMTYDIARFVDSTYHDESLNELYEGDIWKKASSFSGQHRHDALVQLYEDKLKEDTKAQYVWSFRVSDTYMKRTKYYIIYATHSFKGLYIMKRIMRKEGSGIFEYLGPEEEMFKRILRFEPIDLSKWLKKYFKGREVTFDELIEELYPVSRSQISQYIDSDYRKAIQDLENKGDPNIEIIRVTSTRDGLRGNDIIKFK